VSAGSGHNASGGISPGSGGSATTPAGTAGSGAGGGGAHGGLGGSGHSAGAAGSGGAGSTMTDNSLLTGVTIATASTTGNGTVTLDWLSD